jgi:hypothetical protein
MCAAFTNKTRGTTGFTIKMTLQDADSGIIGATLFKWVNGGAWV